MLVNDRLGANGNLTARVEDRFDLSLVVYS